MRHANSQSNSLPRTLRIIGGLATALVGLFAIASSVTVVDDATAAYPQSAHPHPQFRTAQPSPLMLTAVFVPQLDQQPDQQLDDPAANLAPDWLPPPPALAFLIPGAAAPESLVPPPIAHEVELAI
jgi:hypothetical protein